MVARGTMQAVPVGEVMADVVHRMRPPVELLVWCGGCFARAVKGSTVCAECGSRELYEFQRL